MITSIYHWHRSIYMGLSVHPNKILFHEISREIQVLDPLSEQNNNKKWSVWSIVPNLLHIDPNSRELIFVSSPRFYLHRDAQFLLFHLFLLICARTLLILIIGRYRPTIVHLLHRFNLYWHFFTLNQHQLSIKLSILLLRDSFSVPHTHLENWKVWTGYLVIINRPLEWYWKRPVASTNFYWMANSYKRDKFLFLHTIFVFISHLRF